MPNSQIVCPNIHVAYSFLHNSIEIFAALPILLKTFAMLFIRRCSTEGIFVVVAGSGPLRASPRRTQGRGLVGVGSGDLSKFCNFECLKFYLYLTNG